VSSFSQWSAAQAKRGPARVTWVCGAERVLVQEVVRETSAVSGADDIERWVAGLSKERDIWSAVLAFPTRGRKRLVVVYDAGRLSHWEQLQIWLSARSEMQGSYLIFRSESPDFPKNEDGSLADPVSWLRDSSLGQIVRCAPLSTEGAVSWISGKLPGLSTDKARHLLFRASGSLDEVGGVLRKAAYFGGVLDDAAIDLLCAELPGDFADRLIMKDKDGAMQAAEFLTAELLACSIGVLASRLETLIALHRAGIENMSRRDVITKLGVSAFLAQKYARYASAYTEERSGRCWQALAVAEDASRSGIMVGVPEILVASWWS
jgi:hypothetical protein